MLHPAHLRRRLLAVLLLAQVSPAFAASLPAPPFRGPAASAIPGMYAADFVATAATARAMNAAGDVVGTSYVDTGCGSTCLPPQETVVWRGSSRIVLPVPPGYTIITANGINVHGWVAGSASGTAAAHAVVWKPNGSTYDVLDLGTLPGTSVSNALGIDDFDRVVGWSTTSTFPPGGSPFMWTEASGLVDLWALGYPREAPAAISPGGTVAVSEAWYRLGNPASVRTMAPAPSGFLSGGASIAINDAGDQARFLTSTSTQNLAYLFRYHNQGTWQPLSPTGSGRLAPWGVGSINASLDVTATIVGTGVIAYGPNGLAETLASRLSPAYQGADVLTGGPVTDGGLVLARVMIGRSPRLMRLTAAVGCTSGCIRVSDLQMYGDFIDDPNAPGSCTPNAKDFVTATVLVTDERGTRLPGVLVKGRFLDDYWMDKRVSGITDQQGTVVFRHLGPACVGAIAFLVDEAAKGARTFDRTTGILTGYVIPLP